MTFRHRNTAMGWARLDRWYVQPDMLDHTEPLDMVAAARVSDHDALGITYGTFDPTKTTTLTSLTLNPQQGYSGQSRQRRSFSKQYTDRTFRMPSAALAFTS